MLIETTCKRCAESHGSIVSIEIAERYPEIKVHKNCLCSYVPMRTIRAGTATDLGEDGADAYLLKYRKLPDRYLKKDDAIQSGWKKKLSKDLPGIMIGGDKYDNNNKKLPRANNRIWYEVDINYISGKRNRQRILYSNDGLIFVTYNHYHTFYEIVY